MSLRRLFLEADLAGIRPLHFTPVKGGGWRCSFNGDPDFSQIGADGRSALERLLRKLRAI